MTGALGDTARKSEATCLLETTAVRKRGRLSISCDGRVRRHSEKSEAFCLLETGALGRHSEEEREAICLS